MAAAGRGTEGRVRRRAAEAAELVIALDDADAVLGKPRGSSCAPADATLRLERIELRVDEALAERKERLEKVLAEIGDRSEEMQFDDPLVHVVARRYAARAPKTRARQIGAVLTDGTQPRNAIGEQFEQIRVDDRQGTRPHDAPRFAPPTSR